MLKIVIVGGGLAGHRSAVAVRKLSSEASISLLSLEDGLPYDRPPLSKDLLLGRLHPAQIILPQAPDYRQLGIDYRPHSLVTGIDRKECVVSIANEEPLRYDRLLLATGSRPRRLPAGIDSSSICYLRTLTDALKLRERLTPARKVTIIGGGLIGLEVAAAACAIGCRVTVVEAQDRILSRGIPRLVSTAIEELHRSHGVQLLLSERVLSIRECPAGFFTLQLSSGKVFDADVVVAGIGVDPNIELAADAGLALDNGIVVDAACRTSDPKIFAAGEVTSHPDRLGRHRRLESWKLAFEQPLIAASSMLGEPLTYDTPAWFWSDQFDLNLQVLGDLEYAVSHCIKGDISTRSWTLIGLDRAGRPVGAIALNNGRDISMLRSIIRNNDVMPKPMMANVRKIDLPTAENLIYADR